MDLEKSCKQLDGSCSDSWTRKNWKHVEEAAVDKLRSYMIMMMMMMMMMI